MKLLPIASNGVGRGTLASPGPLVMVASGLAVLFGLFTFTVVAVRRDAVIVVSGDDVLVALPVDIGGASSS